MLGDLWNDLKKHPAMLIGIAFAILAVLYIVYKSSAANQQTSSGSTAPNQNTPGGQSSQLGGYVMLDEVVVNPPPVTVNVSGGGSRLPHQPSPPPHNPGGPKKKHGPKWLTDAQIDRLDTYADKHGKAPLSAAYSKHHVTHIKSPVDLHVPPQHNTRVVKK